MVSHVGKFGCRVGNDATEKTREGSGIYLGEDGGPDGLNLLDLGGTQKSLELVGLNEGFRG